MDVAPIDNKIAYVIIEHLSNKFESVLDEILSKHTKMAVKVAEDNMLIEATTVYIIPPAKYLSVSAGKLQLSDIGLPGAAECS